MGGIFDILCERGFIAQATHFDEVRELLNSGEAVTFYVGFDPTADSLHIGHFIPIMAMAHLQRAGHRPIALVGGGTTMVGDPSGRTDMRAMMTPAEISANAERFKKQLSLFLDFGDGRALMANNADWLLKLNYVDFLREIGAHFSVNRMLAADCYKSRLEKGLSFIEFNYMLMQSYDFLELSRRYGCRLQIGGDDQWSNIISGVDLIRRKTSREAFGLTMSLLLTSDGVKMGKTQKGALWIDPAKTPPFEFYQYWRNVHDADVINCLKLLTFLPLGQIGEMARLKDSEINRAKKLLAYEVTKIVHGEDSARQCADAADALFSGGRGGVAGVAGIAGGMGTAAAAGGGAGPYSASASADSASSSAGGRGASSGGAGGNTGGGGSGGGGPALSSGAGGGVGPDGASVNATGGAEGVPAGNAGAGGVAAGGAKGSGIFGVGAGAVAGVPSTALPQDVAEAGIGICDLLVMCKLAPSKSEARRLISQGGITMGGNRAADPFAVLTAADFNGGALVIQKGKKTYHRVLIGNIG
jgi:tyrosyl-tRNA synthetase